MNEIHIARTLLRKRKEKGVTQDELARYIGVSKASVSKWETMQSYPDITLLPRLAAYFNISIDELMGYEAQMTMEDIRALYQRLSAAFAERPYDEVLAECHDAVNQYYACFPLLLQMGALLVNHSMLAESPEGTAAAVTEARALFVRVRQESGDAELCKQALILEALCCLMQQEPLEALELLDSVTGTVQMNAENLAASAYQMMGKQTEARRVLQIGIYQNVIALMSLLCDYLPLCTDDPERFEESCRRVFSMAEAFQVQRLHPATLMTVYLVAAQGYTALDRRDTALELLERYTQLACDGFFPLKLRGDGYFDLLEPWFDRFPLGTAMPRDEKTVRQSMFDAVAHAPQFEALRGNARFEGMVRRLEACRKGS